ncbi:DeoR/GlpR family DNA-binding transcription regulator [Vibrio sp. S4M6]|uniref:DeoR/GlpR family DNA-binding transcription regulator n=1 Tax=Vibrio sinus TaxID=2946865 RepID=UPI002029BC98|nr:DeoR/GlpR family DNA-binding transcription regulator [Vibrio sinus]MCL9782454.1 DeoR/GlpR family DNA-binding transcription regulator [Vibrio sinus]
MTQEERLISMQTWLKKAKKITLTDICQRFEISRDSARRDLVKLTQLPGIERIRGGAICVSVTGGAVAYSDKPISQAKQEIAQAAASLVSPDDYLIIDTGTTLTAMASYLSEPATVITNSVDILSQLSQVKMTAIHLIGGRFNDFHRAMLGSTAIAQLSQYHVNKAFIGVCAISSHGVSTTSEEEAAVKKAMISQAQKVILVCESSKFGQQHVFKVCDLEKIDVIVTNQAPSASLCDLIRTHDIQLIVTSSEN